MKSSRRQTVASFSSQVRSLVPSTSSTVRVYFMLNFTSCFLLCLDSSHCFGSHLHLCRGIGMFPNVSLLRSPLHYLAITISVFFGFMVLTLACSLVSKHRYPLSNDVFRFFELLEEPSTMIIGLGLINHLVNNCIKHQRTASYEHTC